MEPQATLQTTCCIVGGGPSGMMLGYLLARAGIPVTVLEKHKDFLRDFRGDTVHPSTLEVLYELGLLDAFLQRPHQEFSKLAGRIGDVDITLASFEHAPTHCKFICLMPQWDFLDFLVQSGKRFPTFSVRMLTEAVDLIMDGETVAGVRANSPDGPLEIRARLVVSADGRHSKMRERAGFVVQDVAAPIDVLWMRIPRKATDAFQPLGRVVNGQILVMLNRDDYWQCAYVIPKGGYEQIKARGIEALRANIASLAPVVADRVDALHDWNDVSLLTVTIDRLKEWARPGMVCIGDAAHAMSPVGGVGINLAIQDAVAAANALALSLRSGNITLDDLKKVQARREFPTKVTQWIQVQVQNRLFGPALAGKPIGTPWPLTLIRKVPYLQRFPAQIIGVGVRPEHVQIPEAPPIAS